MNPIVASAAFGFLKGLWAGRRLHTLEPVAHVMGPLREELLYRALPFAALGAALPRGATALPFAFDHVLGEAGRHGYTGRQVAARFADTLLGGLLYEAAFRQWGLLGAVAAHASHNIMCSYGQRAGRVHRGSALRRRLP